MAEKTPSENSPARPLRRRPQRLDLPFTRRKKDTVTWIYDHRAGIYGVLMLYLLVAIMFIGYKIIVRVPDAPTGIVVDMRTLEELQKEKERLEREVQIRRQNADAENSYIRNIVSNEGAELRDDRNTDMAAIRERVEDVTSSMRSNRDIWDQGMQEIEAMKNDRENGEANPNSDSRAKGRVMVSFSLLNPTRFSADLVNPGYRCERGGEIVVNITVNRNGDVVSASVDRALSDSDDCMHETALDAARRSRFNVDSSAPDRQTGTITYLFIPQ